MPEAKPRDPVLAEEARDLKWRIWLVENCDGVDDRLKSFPAWARGRLKEIEGH